MKRARLFVGTSGWIYKEWAGTFYPDEVTKGKELEFYASQFNSVEVNATFYRLPLLSATQNWRERTPPHFVFAVKGSRYLTHIKRLRATRVSIRKFFNRLAPLKSKCGPILWQLPPNFPFDPERLEDFLTKLPAGHHHAVEVRHPSWYEHEETFAILRRHRAAHVALSSGRMPMNVRLTARFAYVRFHGLQGGARHDYTRAELRPWAEFARHCLQKDISVYAYFNNDLNTRAPLNAELFKSLVQGQEHLRLAA